VIDKPQKASGFHFPDAFDFPDNFSFQAEDNFLSVQFSVQNIYKY
jgi:hypothetical protein